MYVEREEEVKIIYIVREEEVYPWTSPCHCRWEIGFVLTIDRGRVSCLKFFYSMPYDTDCLQGREMVRPR